MNKNKKTILPLLFVALFSLLVVLAFVLIKSKNPSPANTSENLPVNITPKNPEIFFASNGKNTVYKIKKGDKWSVIWNKSEGKEYDFVSNPVFSFDGTQIAYNAELNGQAYVVVNNNQEINSYIKANYITFSKDGKTIAFVATKGANSYVVISVAVGGNLANESQEYSQIGVAEDGNGNSTAIIMNDDGSKIAYVIKEDGKTYVVINGQKSQGYDDILSFSFSEDGSSFTYEAQNGDSVLTITDNQVVSSTDSDSSANQNENDDTNNTSSIIYPSATYRYKISTQKDVTLDKNRLDYTECENPDGCNF